MKISSNQEVCCIVNAFLFFLPPLSLFVSASHSGSFCCCSLCVAHIPLHKAHQLLILTAPLICLRSEEDFHFRLEFQAGMENSADICFNMALYVKAQLITHPSPSIFLFLFQSNQQFRCCRGKSPV